MDDAPNSLFEQAFVSAPIGMALVDANGFCIKANQALCNLLGYTEEELSRVSFFTYTHPDDLYQDIEYLERAKNDSLVGAVYEKRYFHKNGDILTIVITLSAVKDEVGGVKYFIAQIQDLTELKQLQNLAFDDRERYRIITKSALDIISEHSVDGEYQFVTDSCMTTLGYEPAELIGNKGYEFFHPDDVDMVEHAHNTVLRTTDSYFISFRFRHKLGHYVWIESSISSFRDKNGNVKGVLCFSRDITFRKESETLFIQSEKLSVAGQLAAGLAHEIRNPLTSLKGFLQLLRSHDNKDYYFDIMESELSRIELILSELLVLSKPQVQNKQPRDLVKLIYDVCTLMHSEALLSNVEIRNQIPYEAFTFICDDNQLKQVFINFFKNAIDAMSSGGELSISLEKQDTSFIIRIEDTGPGIPEEIIPLLGQPFYSTKEKGTGLGLMVSYKIIEEHGGRITVSSKQNQGTTFLISFPNTAFSK